MSDREEGAAPRARSRQALTAMAAAIRCALNARQAVIATRDDGSWTVRGAAPAGTDKVGHPGRLRGLDDAQPDVVVPVSVRVDGDWWQLAPAPSAPGEAAAIVSADDDRGGRVLLVATGLDDRRHVPRMKVLHAAAVDAVRAEDKAHRVLLRDSLDQREDERRRWARELHDETLQQLGALQVLLTSVRQRPDAVEGSGPESVLLALDQAIELLSSQIVSLRHLINELRPAALDELGLRPPLEALAERTEQLTGLHVEMRVSLPYSDGLASTRLLPDVELAVYRVVQEALTNAARHSLGTRVWVRVVEEGDQVQVEVSDNGTGAFRVAGFGIDGMRERATLAGGRLDVGPRSADGGGTTVRMVLPALHRQPSPS